MSAIPNSDGILLRNSSGNLIGRVTGPHSIRCGGNVISGNVFQGINDILDSGDVITGNVIGRTADNSAPLRNQIGFYIADAATATIGTERDPNVIADNLSAGLWVVTSSYGVRISANSIFHNGFQTTTAIGIDLNAPDGVTLNDPGDSDTGPNGPSGNLTFSTHFPPAPSAPIPIVTATATDLSGNTSEFSACSPSG